MSARCRVARNGSGAPNRNDDLTLVASVVGIAGVTGRVGAESAPLPTALIAVTVNVYAVLVFKPVIVADIDEPLTDVTAPPGEAVTR